MDQKERKAYFEGLAQALHDNRILIGNIGVYKSVIERLMAANSMAELKEAKQYAEERMKDIAPYPQKYVP